MRKDGNGKCDSIYRNRIFITAAAVVILIMYYFCRVNDSDALRWILAPTARWVSILGRIPFEYLPHRGYVNHDYRFLIAPSCAGCRFMLIAFLMTVFLPGRSGSMSGSKEDREKHGAAITSVAEKDSLVRSAGKHDGREHAAQMLRNQTGGKWIWFGCSMLLAYVSTIFVNGIRIVVSIYLPAALERRSLMSGWLTPDSLEMTGQVLGVGLGVLAG